jgi:excisionase family DNA binding protein
MQEGFASVAEAAAFMSLGKTTLYRLIDDGVVDARRFGRTVRIPWSWLHDQAKNRKAEPAPDQEVVYGTLRTRIDAVNGGGVRSAQ